MAADKQNVDVRQYDEPFNPLLNAGDEPAQ